MKKLIILAMLFSCLGIQQASAQKWARKLGKVANVILTDDKKNTQQTTSSAENNVVSSNPDISFLFRKCVRQGNNVAIIATVKNNTGKDFRFFTRDPTIYDSDGESYKLDWDACKFANTHWGYGTDITIPSGVPIKAIFMIKDVPVSVTELSIAKFSYSVWPTSTQHYFEIRNQAIAAQ